MASSSLPQAHKAFSRLIATDESTFSTSPVASAQPEALVASLREQIIGEDQFFSAPFGDRKVTYADYTASGRAVAGVEDFIRDVILTRYANTHTTTSVTGHQTSLFRHEAKLLIKRLVNANFSHGNAKVIFFFFPFLSFLKKSRIR
jgi:selenocysteine lyase/cysteine desulfurase